MRVSHYHTSRDVLQPNPVPVTDTPTPECPYDVSVMPRKHEYKITKKTLTMPDGAPLIEGMTTYEATCTQPHDICRIYDVLDNEFYCVRQRGPDDIPGAIASRKVTFQVPAWEGYYRWHITDGEIRAYPEIVKIREEEALRSVKNAYFKHFIESMTKEKVKIDADRGSLVVANAEAAAQIPIVNNYHVTQATVTRSLPRRQTIHTIGTGDDIHYVPGITTEQIEATVQVVGNRYIGEPLTGETTTNLQNEITRAVNDQLYRSMGIPANYLDPNQIVITNNTAAVTATGAWNDWVYTNTNSITVDTTNLQDLIWNGSTIKVVYNVNQPMYVQSAAEAVKSAIRGNIKSFPHVLKNTRSLPSTITPEEQKARDTLRDLISEAQYRRYLTNGFIMVRGPKTGRFYQVFMNHRSERIRVYEQGKHINNICIHTTDDCPPTDHVINMKVMIECDEESFAKAGNIHAVHGNLWGNAINDVVRQATEPRGILDVYRSAKQLEDKQREAQASYRPDELIAVAG